MSTNEWQYADPLLFKGEESPRPMFGWLFREVASCFKYMTTEDIPFSDDAVLKEIKNNRLEWVTHQNGIWFRKRPMYLHWGPIEGMTPPWIEAPWGAEVQSSVHASYKRWFWKHRC